MLKGKDHELEQRTHLCRNNSNANTAMRQRTHAKSLWSCLILCERKDCSPTGSSVHGFPRQEYWSGLPCPPPGDLSNPGTEPVSLMSPALAGGLFTTSITQKALAMHLSIRVKRRHFIMKDRRSISAFICPSFLLPLSLLSCLV